VAIFSHQKKGEGLGAITDGRTLAFRRWRPLSPRGKAYLDGG
jgi:hypothetical protein